MFQQDVPLSQYSNYKIGGPARYFIAVKTANEVVAAANEAKKMALPIFVLGGGTNLLINDTGFAGLVMRAEFNVLKLESDNQVRVGAGVLMKELVQFCIDNSLSGMEWAGGLPGTVGGAVWGNAGAFKGEMKDSLINAESVDISAEPTQVKRANAECEFGYRNSIFKKNAAKGITEVITELVFQLQKGNQEDIKKATQEKIDYRVAKQPLDYPNIGSIFKNTDIKRVPTDTLKKFSEKIKTDPFPVLPTAVLTGAAGLAGKTIGGAMVSSKHTNFIINATGKATAADVKALIAVVREEVKKQFGVELEKEVIEV